ncbi:hypothetical protein IEE_05088 [Bacillus cereus BAG5X1-1]|uniref:Reverse transcriptase domain-containing protein n=1 Tax=Bacillus cereus BAG5X1-1 TaxID=1053189 RepID=J7ZPS0_BACCE|nr:hypothetical protein [Bacillus cereus]EJQ38316.1 hypothetical protein IEE_05088 [Bacillus cereus BAG5X1-1]
MQTRLRYADYYNLTSTFDELYQRSKTGENFTRLYDLIISRENILLAYRNIKRNSGAKTSGTDGKTISYLENLKDEQIVRLVRDKLISYREPPHRHQANKTKYPPKMKKYNKLPIWTAPLHNYL